MKRWFIAFIAGVCACTALALGTSASAADKTPKCNLVAPGGGDPHVLGDVGPQASPGLELRCP